MRRTYLAVLVELLADEDDVLPTPVGGVGLDVLHAHLAEDEVDCELRVGPFSRPVSVEFPLSLCGDPEGFAGEAASVRRFCWSGRGTVRLHWPGCSAARLHQLVFSVDQQVLGALQLDRRLFFFVLGVSQLRLKSLQVLLLVADGLLHALLQPPHFLLQKLAVLLHFAVPHLYALHVFVLSQLCLLDQS